MPPFLLTTTFFFKLLKIHSSESIIQFALNVYGAVYINYYTFYYVTANKREPLHPRRTFGRDSK